MAQGEPEPNCPSLRAIGKNCYPVPTTSDRSFEPCGVQRQVQLRYSKQPGRSSALRSISNNAKARPIVGLSERVYESTKLAAPFRDARRPGLPGRRNTEKRQPSGGGGALSEVKDFARGIDNDRQRDILVLRAVSCLLPAAPRSAGRSRAEWRSCRLARGGRECSCGSADLDRQPNLALSSAAAQVSFNQPLR
jgi:hypothetical protein